MADRKISALPINTSPTLNDVFPTVNNGITKKLSLSGLTTFIQPLIAPNVKHWVESQVKTIGNDETIVISGNYVLNNCNLILQSGATQFFTGNLVFNKYSQIFIGGYLLLVDSTIVNNGLISVGGAIILSGNSNITGNGTII